MNAPSLAVVVGGTRGTEIMRVEIEDAIPVAWLFPTRHGALSLGDEHWLRWFSPVGVSLMVARHLAYSSFTFQEDGKLMWYTTAIADRG